MRCHSRSSAERDASRLIQLRLSTSQELSLAALFVEYLLAECWFGPTVAALQKSAPSGAQGLTQGALLARLARAPYAFATVAHIALPSAGSAPVSQRRDCLLPQVPSMCSRLLATWRRRC